MCKYGPEMHVYGREELDVRRRFVADLRFQQISRSRYLMSAVALTTGVLRLLQKAVAHPQHKI